MTEVKLSGGAYVKATRPLMVAREALVNSADDIMIDAGNDGWVTHAAPGVGSFWVLGQVTPGFDITPLGSFRLEIWYNVGAGNVVVFDSYVGAGLAVAGVSSSIPNPVPFPFPVSLRFPDNAQMRVTLYSGDGACASSLNIISWVETTV